MTMESAEPRTSVGRFLPWIVAAAALALYLWTLNPWLSMGNLLQVARTSGWTWQEELHGPLYWLVIAPLRLLPARMVPYALNLFSAVCAALSLALLARSVMLLPHDRTHEQREKEKSEFSLLSIRSAWLPPVLAALVCGLQLTFWQCATAATCDWITLASNQMFDLLLFAYIIRCVLEARIDEDGPWLTRAAFIYGLAITNNWAMIAYFPLFLTALVWIRGLGFFNQRFLARMFLWGFAGLLLYLLLPLVQSMADISKVPFWESLVRNLKIERSALATLPFSKPAVLSGDHPLWVLGMSSLLPVLMMSIRWPSNFGDPSRIGVAISTLILHVANAALMLLCIWVALGSPLSPIHVLAQITTNQVAIEPGLTLYYLGALSVGYFAAYFLLVFSNPAERSRRVPDYIRISNFAVQTAMWLLAIVTPVLIFVRTLPLIRQYNGPMFQQYASGTVSGLPKQPTFVLSDDPMRLLLTRGELAREGRDNDYMFVETRSMENLDYHRFQLKKYGSRWPVDLAHQEFYSSALIQWLTQILQSNQVYYLHPSLGYYFEAFYTEPHGLVYQMKAYPTNMLLAPPLSEAILDENEAFWTKMRADAVDPLALLIDPPPPTNVPPLMKAVVRKLHLVTDPNADAQLLGTFYSRALVYWGAELQKAGRLTKAGYAFESAERLNPDNVVATINLACNKSLQTGTLETPPDQKAIEDKFGKKYRTWSAVIDANGPFDDANFCYGFALECRRGSLFRQAAQQFARVKQLAPGKLEARLRLADLYVMARMPNQAMTLIKEIHAQPDVVGLGRSNRASLAYVESLVFLATDDVAGTEAEIERAAKEYPESAEVLVAGGSALNLHGHYTNALPFIDRALKIEPKDADALVQKAYAHLQLQQFDKAIEPLTTYLHSYTNDFRDPRHWNALMNRAISYLQTGRLDEAEQDYQAVLKASRPMFQIYYGLAEIAWRKQDTNAAIRNYQLYLNSSPANPEEVKLVRARLKQLRPSP